MTTQGALKQLASVLREAGWEMDGEGEEAALTETQALQESKDFELKASRGLAWTSGATFLAAVAVALFLGLGELSRRWEAGNNSVGEKITRLETDLAASRKLLGELQADIRASRDNTAAVIRKLDDQKEEILKEVKRDAAKRQEAILAQVQAKIADAEKKAKDAFLAEVKPLKETLHTLSTIAKGVEKEVAEQKKELTELAKLVRKISDRQSSKTPPEPEKDTPPLGRWRAMDIRTKDKNLSPIAVEGADLVLSFEDKQVRVFSGRELLGEGTYEIKGRNRTIDIEFNGKDVNKLQSILIPHKERSIKMIGLFEVSEKTTMRVALGKERPASVMKPAEGVVLFVLRRLSKEKGNE